MPWLGVHEASDVKKMEWLIAAALDWRCLALTPASFLDQLLCDAWQGPLFYSRGMCATSLVQGVLLSNFVHHVDRYGVRVLLLVPPGV